MLYMEIPLKRCVDLKYAIILIIIPKIPFMMQPLLISSLYGVF